MDRSGELHDIDGVFGDSIRRLDAWFDRNGWSGYDPYDFLEHRFFRKKERAGSGVLRFIARARSWGLLRIENRAPILLRRMLGVKRRVNAKAMGLLVGAYTQLYAVNHDEHHLAKAKECAAWLTANASTQYAGMSWGYPFDWQSIVMIPKGTPSAVVSSIVGDGFWCLYRETKDEAYLTVCERICEFLTKALNRTELPSGSVCLSYTPVDHYTVHNANLMAAEFLARIGKECDRFEWLDLAQRMGDFALEEQNDDGSIFYWGRAQQQHNPAWLDCYHSGFEIRGLWGLWIATQKPRYRAGAERYFDFFVRAYFGGGGQVMTRPGKLYPIDIHACAEFLLCVVAVDEIRGKEWSESTLTASAKWIRSRMANHDGSFAAKALSPRRIKRIPFVRWGEAWMMRALVAVLHRSSQETMQ